MVRELKNDQIKKIVYGSSERFAKIFLLFESAVKSKMILRSVVQVDANIISMQDTMYLLPPEADFSLMNMWCFLH